MSDDYTTTPNFGLYKPTPNADYDLWGDHLNANADKLDAVIKDIVVAGSISLNQIDAAAFGVQADFVELSGTIGWSGTTVTISGASFTSADIGKTLIMPAGAGVGVYGGPAIVEITAVANSTTCTVDTSTTHAFSGVTTVVGGNGASPWAVDVVNPGTGGSLVGDVLTITGGTFARPATLQTIQTTVLSATVVNAGTGGPVGAVLLRGTTGYGRRVVLSGNINAGGSLDPTLSVTVLPAGTTTGADPGAYWYDVDDPNNEPVLANPRKVTWPGAFVTGSATLTLNAAVLSPLVMPSVHVGASVFAVGDSGAVAFPAGTVVVSTGTPDPTSAVVSQVATTNGTGQQISFTDNREDIIFPATFANNVSTVTATTAVPAGVSVGQVIFGLGISGGDDPTAPLSNCTITSIDGTRTAIGISRPTTHAATTAVNLHAVPYLTGAVVKLNLGPAVLAFKDFGAYSTAPDFTVAQPVLRNGSASSITIQQAPPPQVMTQPIKVSMGTDNTVAINAWLAAVRSALATDASGGAGLEALLRPGAYLTTGNINARDLNENGLTIRASGVMIHAAIANQDPSPVDKTIQRAWDASGSRYYTMQGNFVLYGDQLFPPDTGAVFAYSSANQITSSVSLTDITVWGYFKFCSTYFANTEGYVVSCMDCSNHHTWSDGRTPCYGRMIDGSNTYGKLDAPNPTGTHGSFLGFIEDTGTATCVGGAIPFSIIACTNYSNRGGYAASWSGPSIFFSKSGHATLDIHCEVETLTDNIFMWCPTGLNANNVAAFINSSFFDAASEATNSVISYDTLGKFGVPIRELSASNSSVGVGFFAPASRAQVFDDHSLFAGGLNWHGSISISGALKTASMHWLDNFPDDREGMLLIDGDTTNFKGDFVQCGSISSSGVIYAGDDITTSGLVNAAHGFAIGTAGFPQGWLTFDGTQINSNVPISLPNGSVAVTQAPGDNDTSVATTAFVQAAASAVGGAFLPLSGGTVTGATTFNSGLTSLYSQALSGAGTPVPSAQFGGSYSGTSTATGTYSTVWLTASADTLAAPALNVCMLSVEPHLAAGWQGSRIGVRSFVATAGNTNLTSSVAANAGAVIGFSGGSFSNHNMGGVGTGYGTTQFGLGTQWGAVLQSTMQAGSTWWNSSIGVEIDNAILSGGNAIWNIGLLINLYPTSQVQGQAIDAAQVIAAGGTTKWINGILIGTGTGHSIDPNGYFIRGIGGGGGPRTAAGGVDMLQPNFNGTGTGGGGFAFRAPNFQVLNAGYAQVGPGLLSFSAGGLIVDSPYQQVTAAAVAAGGTGFTVNDLLEGTDGTFASVTTVSAGAVTGVSILRSGWGLTGSLPTNPVVFTAQGRNGATRGSGCTLNLTWTPATGISINPSGGATTFGGGGVGFGSTLASSFTDLSHHIRLYSTTYGIGVFTSQMFFNIPAANWYNFIIGGAVAAQLTAGQLSLQAATSNWLTLGSFGTGPPAFTTRSVGTKVILFSAITGSTADVAIGVDANTMWSSVRTTADQFRWYGGTTVAATLSGVGALSLTSGIGAFGTAAVTTKPTVSGAKGSNAALASLMTALAAYGLVTDSTTA